MRKRQGNYAEEKRLSDNYRAGKDWASLIITEFLVDLQLRGTATTSAAGNSIRR
jgi:hypothetical protein